MARRRSSLQRQISVGLVLYVLLLSAALAAHGLLVNEQAERRVWQSLLNVEMDHVVARVRERANPPWAPATGLRFYADQAIAASPPPALMRFGPGLHDNVVFDDNEWVVLVRLVGDGRYMLALDIDGFEQDEWRLAAPLLLLAALMALLLALFSICGVRRLVRPLAALAERILELRPDRTGQRIEVGRGGSSELVVIAEALNAYLERNERFVERERVFIDSASHELRTPIAVVAGAADLALARPIDDEAVRAPLQRIARTARAMEQLVVLLLVLARDPARLSAASDRFRLDELLPELVEDHRFLATGKSLEIEVALHASCELVAPVRIVQAAIGNLLRNAIENSDRGRIRVELHPAGVVVIDDPGHGMAPEEVAAIYARIARGGGRESSDEGIGLDLIARLCEHLSWRLVIDSGHGRGTRATLDLGAAVA
ncbi:sensor histidine kinase [Coralloluteibacterium stylophorae]|uniref:histidine kinase n=1 Tax=Coralloluteibacterium stylophorae TaxID=1776034 RepID=A0A8J7VRJ7_9GAMM|nr:HAMP domain-containing sensor histidine kinase [Coralloluteibacterium stylophorae]MBS7457076.1 HAMP domain-containing histidine kinase [Coralloluteibacterium stylophorae]